MGVVCSGAVPICLSPGIPGAHMGTGGKELLVATSLRWAPARHLGTTVASTLGRSEVQSYQGQLSRPTWPQGAEDEAVRCSL